MDSRVRDIAGLLQAGRHREAEIACRSLLAARPADAAVLNLQGIALRQQDRLDEAEIAFRRAVEYSGGNAEFRTNLAQLLRARGRLRPAIVEFRQAVAAAPGFRPARLGLARAALQAGESLLAEQEARALVAADERDFEAWSALGFALYALARPLESADAFGRAVALEPHYAAAQTNLAIVQGVLDRPADALETLAACDRLGIKGRGLELTRARALIQLERYDESEIVLQRLAAQSPDDGETQLLLAQLRHVRGDAGLARG